MMIRQDSSRGADEALCGGARIGLLVGKRHSREPDKHAKQSACIDEGRSSTNEVTLEELA
jgi:hypothetical protein